jgi:hypothetical protein
MYFRVAVPICKQRGRKGQSIIHCVKKTSAIQPGNRRYKNFVIKKQNVSLWYEGTTFYLMVCLTALNPFKRDIKTRTANNCIELKLKIIPALLSKSGMQGIFKKLRTFSSTPIGPKSSMPSHRSFTATHLSYCVILGFNYRLCSVAFWRAYKAGG